MTARDAYALRGCPAMLPGLFALREGGIRTVRGDKIQSEV